MANINSKIISKLYTEYCKFTHNTNYRETEDFYKKSEILELSYNENPLGPGTRAIEIMKEFSSKAHLYPPIAYRLLKKDICKRNNLSEKEVFIGSGSLFIINSLIYYFSGKNNEVIYSKSSIPMYKWGILSNGSLPKEIPLDLNMNHNFDDMIFPRFSSHS